MRNLLHLGSFCILFLTACSSVTNLTPSTQSRANAGLYPVEFVWSTRQQSVRPESVKPYVLVGTEMYPMYSTPLVTNRWEAMVPVPPNEKFLHYRIKVDYEYNAIPKPRKNSQLSEEYRLEIQ
jgi:hypothetical protein